MSPPQIRIYCTFSAIMLTDLLILHAVLLFLVVLVHHIINYTAMYDVITDVCLFTFFMQNLK